jgi:cysteinyl-tRNA synthetase
MSMKLLGPSFDLHLGGEDLIFPHHEDEIAQSEGAGLQAPGRRFVRYWLHAAHLMVEGKKMSKSLGNYFTLRDLLAKGCTGREIRYLLLTAHYRESFNFTMEGLQGARGALARLDECLAKLKAVAGAVVAEPDSDWLGQFSGAMDDDLNVSAAWRVVFDWVREANRRLTEGGLQPSEAAAALAAWQRVDSVFRIGTKAEAEAPADVLALLDKRQAARKAKDFQRADALRAELKTRGWLIEDTPKGARLKQT